MRAILAVIGLLVSSAASAGNLVYQRGEYQFAVGPQPAFVASHEVQATWDPKAPGASGAPWRYWLYDEQADHRGGHDQFYSEHVFEAVSSSLVSEAGRFEITYNPGYQQLTIHRVELRRNGAWQQRLAPEHISIARREKSFEQDMTDGRVTALVVLDDVRVGDVVRVSYTISGSNPILAGQGQDWARFSWQSPVLESHLRVLYDPGRKLQIYRSANAPEAIRSMTADASEVRMDAHAQPGLQNQDDYPAWYSPYPEAQIAEQLSWRDVIAWALPLYPATSTPLPADAEARIAEWSKLPDADAKIKVALRTVQNQVRYFGAELGASTHRPNPPGETWSRRYGDCKDKAYLLATLLGRLGVQAAPALVSVSRGRAVADFVHTASVFDHVIVRAQLGKEVLWLDPTATLEGGDPRDSDLTPYGVALPIAVGMDGLETIRPSGHPDSGIDVNEKFVPDADGRAVKFDVSTIYHGRAADSARRRMQPQRIEDISREYADYYRKRFNDVSVASLLQVSDDQDSDRLKVDEHYVLPSPFEASGPGKSLEVFGEALSTVSALPQMTRSGPLRFEMPADFRHEVVVEMPERWTTDFASESVSHASPAFDYTRKLEVAPHKVSLVYDMHVLAPEVAPDQVSTHLQQLHEVRDSLSARLHFQIPASVQREERDVRLKALLQSVIDKK